jgi:hypothetical protein
MPTLFVVVRRRIKELYYRMFSLSPWSILLTFLNKVNEQAVVFACHQLILISTRKKDKESDGRWWWIIIALLAIVFFSFLLSMKQRPRKRVVASDLRPRRPARFMTSYSCFRNFNTQDSNFFAYLLNLSGSMMSLLLLVINFRVLLFYTIIFVMNHHTLPADRSIDREKKKIQDKSILTAWVWHHTNTIRWILVHSFADQTRCFVIRSTFKTDDSIQHIVQFSVFFQTTLVTIHQRLFHHHHQLGLLACFSCFVNLLCCWFPPPCLVSILSSLLTTLQAASSN